ncbi:MAG: HAMP domain-containing protein, partial [Clostridiaceae bacterium]|nr:HAMP domain-containing protein [Clostridiaceae bacterium]
MKRRSIRFKFFVAISAVTLVFIGVLLILNLFFYEDYYMLMRRGELRDAYQGIRNSYSGDIEEMMTVLDNYESQTAIRMAVVCSDGTVLYTSFNTRSDEGNADTQNPFQLPDFDLLDQQRRGYTILQSIAQNVSWNTLDSHSYQFLNVTLWDNDQYLCLAGVLDNQADKCLFAYMPYAYIEQNSSLNLVFLVIAGGCALLICLIFAYGVSRWFSRPLIAMAGLADRMSELDFSTKYQGRSTDEIGQLGQSLNRLSAYLEQTIRELRQSNEQLAQEIKEKERIDNMRQEFIVNVSHELKTPIALIQGYAEGLTAGVADDPEDRKYYCDTIADEADHMNKLVMQLLNLSRLELGAEQTYSEDIDLHELCAEAVRKTAVLCESRGLTVEYDDTCITVRTDGDLLDQVLMNYLSNAIR